MTDALADLHDFNESGDPATIQAVLAGAGARYWGEPVLLRWSLDVPDAIASFEGSLVGIEAAALRLGWTCVRRDSYGLWIERASSGRWFIVAASVKGAGDGMARISGSAEPADRLAA